MKFRHILVSLLITTAITSTSQCTAALWRPSPNVSWTATSSDGKFVFANVSQLPITMQLEERSGSGVDSAELESTIRKVHERFPQTGMYTNDGSRVPLWTFPAPVYRGIPSADGKRLVAIGEGAGTTSCIDLVNVYEANGGYWQIETNDVIPIAEYGLRVLLGGQHTDSFDIYFNTSRDRVVISTLDKDVVEFSLVDAKVLSRTTLSNTLRIVVQNWRGKTAIAVLAVLVFGVAGQLVRLIRAARDARET